MSADRKRIILAKCGLDGHDNGIKVVSQWLRDAGFEVLYLGIYNTPERIIKTVIDEDIRVIGLSFLEGSHLLHSRKIKELAKDNKLEDLKLVVGGVVPPDDVNELKRLGVALVYTPGTPKETIIQGVKSLYSD